MSIRAIPGQNDLLTTNPELAREWHPTKNLGLSPSQVMAGTNKRIWWSCSKNSLHEWEASGASRAKGAGCPFCAGQRVLPGVSDLATTNPELAKEWHPALNGSLTPQMVMKGSSKKVWWQCTSNSSHSWQSTCSNRTAGQGCPYCAGKIVQPGINDLATTHPELAKEWNPLRNEKTPEQVFKGSHAKAWWICQTDPRHQWEISPHSRSAGCPVCSNSLLQNGVNDLATLYPEIAAEWHPKLNGGSSPSSIKAVSTQKVWWQCPVEKSHVWETMVKLRTIQGSSCPVCSNKLVLPGVNDLETLNPQLASQWHPTKNLPLTPRDVGQGAKQKAWWICSIDPRHVWSASIGSRQSLQVGCPVCANLQVLAGYNDLATVHPSLATEWHKDKNKGISPSEVLAGTHKKYWWQCVSVSDHAWEASVKSRVMGTGCPSCVAYGYKTTQPGLFYFLFNKSLNARKIGITNPSAKASRVEKFRENGWQAIRTFEDQDGMVILNLETTMLRWLRKEVGLPPYLAPQDMGRMGGWSETFSTEVISDLQVLKKIEQVLASIKGN